MLDDTKIKETRAQAVRTLESLMSPFNVFIAITKSEMNLNVFAPMTFFASVSEAWCLDGSLPWPGVRREPALILSPANIMKYWR